MYRKAIHARERWYVSREKTRVVRPFEWGTDFVQEHVNGDDPRVVFEEHSRRALNQSESFYELPPIADYKLRHNLLTWTSAVTTPSSENNLARARLFPAKTKSRKAVLILPQWNAQPESHFELCRLLNRFGISALRLSMPYHDARRPADLKRAEHLVSSNVGRTIQSVRQAVLDARAAVAWLKDGGFDRVGIVGFSVGSCTAFLTFAHDEAIDTGVFHHVSGYFADVVWRGISTWHVRKGLESGVTLDELRQYWMPISPYPFISRLRNQRPRPIRYIAARYDLSFPPDLTRLAVEETRRHVSLDVAWLPCGHYTSGERPWSYLSGWKIISFLRSHL